MDNLTLLDLSVIIPLLEQELDKIHQDIDAEDDNISSDAAELSVPYGETASKLERAYKLLWSEDTNYPIYEELIKRS